MALRGELIGCRRRAGWLSEESWLVGEPQNQNEYLHYLHGHDVRGHALHIVHQPMGDLGTDEAASGQTLLLW